MKKNFFLTVRHFHDQNALRAYGHDGPLKDGQEALLATTVEKIIEEYRNSGKKTIRLLTTFKTRRLYDTAVLIAEVLEQTGMEVSLQHDVRLEVLDQGDLILPDMYQDGEWFTPLDVAWDAICDEAYGKKNIFYRFGDHLDGKYPELATSFSRVGESMGDSLISKYDLIYDITHGRLAEENELLVLVAQSDLPLVLMELQVLQKYQNVTAENVPYESWKVYKSGLQEEMYDYTAIGDGNFDIAMGYVGRFELSSFIETGFDRLIKEAQFFLQKQKTQVNEKK